MRARHKREKLQEEKIDDQVCEGKEGSARACITPQRRVRQRSKDYWQETMFLRDGLVAEVSEDLEQDQEDCQE